MHVFLKKILCTVERGRPSVPLTLKGDSLLRPALAYPQDDDVTEIHLIPGPHQAVIICSYFPDIQCVVTPQPTRSLTPTPAEIVMQYEVISSDAPMRDATMTGLDMIASCHGPVLQGLQSVDREEYDDSEVAGLATLRIATS